MELIESQSLTLCGRTRSAVPLNLKKAIFRTELSRVLDTTELPNASEVRCKTENRE